MNFPLSCHPDSPAVPKGRQAKEGSLLDSSFVGMTKKRLTNSCYL
jgi:hypothetical protein